MNTGLLRPAVATAPTVYGIETNEPTLTQNQCIPQLQQHLPFTVLKLKSFLSRFLICLRVATAPTVYGIETI